MTDANSRLARAMSFEWDRRVMANLRHPTPEVQAEMQAAHERRKREQAEYVAEQRRARKARHQAVLDRCDGILAAVVRHHSPGDWWGDDCSGCDPASGYSDSPAEWPCSTFLMIEADLPAVEAS